MLGTIKIVNNIFSGKEQSQNPASKYSTPIH
jgi:hypothetical protein